LKEFPLIFNLDRMAPVGQRLNGILHYPHPKSTP
jgi:hypothetical protein